MSGRETSTSERKVTVSILQFHENVNPTNEDLPRYNPRAENERGTMITTRSAVPEIDWDELKNIVRNAFPQKLETIDFFPNDGIREEHKYRTTKIGTVIVSEDGDIRDFELLSKYENPSTVSP